MFQRVAVILGCVALLAGCPSKFSVDNISVGTLKAAESAYSDCIVKVQEALKGVKGEAEQAKVATKGVKQCVDKYADVVADLLVQGE